MSELRLRTAGINDKDEMILDMAKDNKKKYVRFDALESNTPAQKMYTDMGFANRGKQKGYAINTGWTYFYYMEIAL